MNGQHQPPNRNIVTLIIYFGLLPLVYFVPPIVSKFVDGRLTVVAISLVDKVAM